jgi:hypothetical protein
MADHEAEIPERMENRTHDAFFRLAEMPAEEQQQIDVGMKTELASPVAADGHHGYWLLDSGCRDDQLAQEPVEAIREAGQRRAPAMAPKDVVTKLATRVVERRGDCGA